MSRFNLLMPFLQYFTNIINTVYRLNLLSISSISLFWHKIHNFWFSKKIYLRFLKDIKGNFKLRRFDLKLNFRRREDFALSTDINRLEIWRRDFNVWKVQKVLRQEITTAWFLQEHFKKYLAWIKSLPCQYLNIMNHFFKKVDFYEIYFPILWTSYTNTEQKVSKLLIIDHRWGI